MGSYRLLRVEETLKEEISEIIQKELKDPRIGLITVTSVEVSKDLKHAIIFLSALGGEEEKERCLKGLASAKGYLKQEIGKRLRLKFLPDLEFKIDPSVERGVRISKLINTLHQNQGKKDGHN